jgi:hypothetical protein
MRGRIAVPDKAEAQDRDGPNAVLTAALVVGGAAAATAGAVWSARAIARRNEAGGGKPLNPVMKTAATACELAHGPAAFDSQKPA